MSETTHLTVKSRCLVVRAIVNFPSHEVYKYWCDIGWFDTSLSLHHLRKFVMLAVGDENVLAVGKEFPLLVNNEVEVVFGGCGGLRVRAEQTNTTFNAGAGAY